MALCLPDGIEDILTEPLGSYGPVVAFDIGVLLRLARLDVMDPDTSVLCPSLQSTTDVFGAIIDSNVNGGSTPFDDPIQRANDAQGWQRQIDLNGQPLAIEVINDVEGSEGPAICKLVAHKVH